MPSSLPQEEFAGVKERAVDTDGKHYQRQWFFPTCVWENWGPYVGSMLERWGRSEHPLRRAASERADRCAHSLKHEMTPGGRGSCV